MSEASRPQPWLPESYGPPARVELADGRHLRPIRADDAEIDHPAVMGSRERLWAKYGGPWGWPPATMTLEQDRADLARHEREIESRESLQYALLDAGERRLLGCVYLDPPGPDDDGDVLVSWWVVDECAGSAVEQELDRSYVGISLTPEEQFEIFGTDQLDECMNEARERWCASDAFRESQRRTAAYSKEDWIDSKEDGIAIKGEALAPRGTPHAYGNVGRGRRVRYLIVMTPKIRSLVRALHEPGTADYAAIFRAHDSELLS